MQLKTRGRRIYTRIPASERFWNLVEMIPFHPCWEWNASIKRKGYGQFCLDPIRRAMHAHRFAWESANGPIPDGMCVLHRCDNPRCVRPSHLFLGTREDNNRDMIAKGRDNSRTAREIAHATKRARTHCYKGHSYSGHNLIMETRRGRTTRICRTCKYETNRRCS